MDRSRSCPDGAGRRPTKRWSHRTVRPEETLKRLTPVISAIGITRIADVTGLDRIGIPVFQAVRPLGRLLTVSQGKGATAAAAKVSAAMESIEIWHAENLVLEGIRSTRARLGTAAHIDPALVRKTNWAGPLGDPEFCWVPARDMATGETVLVPRDVADLDFTRDADPAWLRRNTTGLAGGNTFAEAQAWALAEVIERACRAEFGRMDAQQQAARRLDPRSLAEESPSVSSLVTPIFDAGMELDLHDLTNRLGVPTVRAVLYDCGAGRPVQRPVHGHGTHLDPAMAISRAITEAAQARITYISGNRDDLDPTHYQAFNLANLERRLERQMDFSATRRGLEFADQSGATPEADVEIMLARIIEAGAGPVLSLDLSRDDIGVPVAKVLAPGISRAPTKRAAAAAPDASG